MRFVVIVCALALSSCASTAPRTGGLTAYEGLTPKTGDVRAKISQRKDETGLQGVRRVSISPTRFSDAAPIGWMTQQERQVLLREMDAQLCFEISERYDIALTPGGEAHSVRAIVAAVAPTGRVGSAASAAGSFFIPGPIGVRLPAGLGALAAEAELVDPQGRQVAAILWSRRATVIGTDDPSLSRVGDALQMVEPFADAAAASMTSEGARSRGAPSPDPCAAYGPRFRPEGWLAKFATGLYVPAMSGAREATAGGPKP